MADIWDAKRRSAVMSRIRSDNTRPERALRTALRNSGLAVKKRSRLPGRPDIVLADAGLAVFVHGCFWHGCRNHYGPPSSNRRYWREKIEGNMKRDSRVVRQLRRLGWSVMTVWECQVEADGARVAARIQRAAILRTED